MIDWLMLVLLLLAIVLGFVLGRRARPRQDVSDSGVQPYYIRGLNYLLNEQQDAAIDTFIDALDVNAETLETHLALGSLLRKRGEVARAIKIHQNLLARPGLSDGHSQQVQLELARDYIKSGLLDRAEVLLAELVEEASSSIRAVCLEHLIDLYRDEKEWLKGINAINQLAGRRFGRLPDSWRLMQGHFYCELASDAIHGADYLTARRHLRSAIIADKNLARASLLLAELEQKLGNHREAIKALKQVSQQNSQYIPESLPLLRESYQAEGRLKSFRKYLRSLFAEHRLGAVAMELSNQLAIEEGEVAAAEFIRDYVREKPSLKGVGQMLSLQLSESADTDGVVTEGMLAADSLIRGLQEVAPNYRCKSCGFSGQQMHWMCPSCKTWGSMKSID